MKVIAVEGPDYSGKSRLVSIIKEMAEKAGYDVVTQGFPTNVNHGKKARVELAAGGKASVIAHHIENDFRDFSSWVVNEGETNDKTLYILDRYVVTTHSHQGHTIDLSFGEYLVPDVMIVLTIDYNTMLERLRERGADNWDEKETDKYKSPLKWKELNSRYLDGLRHYSSYFKATIEADGTDDKEVLAEQVLKEAGIELKKAV